MGVSAKMSSNAPFPSTVETRKFCHGSAKGAEYSFRHQFGHNFLVSTVEGKGAFELILAETPMEPVKPKINPHHHYLETLLEP
jgi:hypothetical protein